MKSNVCALEKGGKGLDKILAEVEHVAEYNKLGEKQTLRLRLLAEELSGMLGGILDNFSGEFWAEDRNGTYELHTVIKVDEMTYELRNELLKLSSSGKNFSARGIMGKIRAAIDNLILASAGMPFDETMYLSGVGYGVEVNGIYSAWSLNRYRDDIKKQKDTEEAWDELEKSIVANLADDVTVGVKGRKVEVIVYKR